MCSPRERKLATFRLIKTRENARLHWETSYNVVRDVKTQYDAVKAERPPRPNTSIGLVKFWSAWLLRMCIAQAKITGAQQQHQLALAAYMLTIADTKKRLNEILNCNCCTNVGMN